MAVTMDVRDPMSDEPIFWVCLTQNLKSFVPAASFRTIVELSTPLAIISGITFNTEMWKEFKRMVVEAAAETVDDEEEKEQVSKVWGKLISQVIGEMKNGFLLEARQECKLSIEQPRARAQTWTCASDGTKLMTSKECQGVGAKGFSGNLVQFVAEKQLV